MPPCASVPVCPSAPAPLFSVPLCLPRVLIILRANQVSPGLLTLCTCAPVPLCPSAPLPLCPSAPLLLCPSAHLPLLPSSLYPCACAAFCIILRANQVSPYLCEPIPM